MNDNFNNENHSDENNYKNDNGVFFEPDENEYKKTFNYPKSFYLGILAVLLIAILGGNAIVKNMELNKVKQTVNDIYSKSFLELADSVNQIDISLAKGAVSNSATYTSELANRIYAQANAAQNSLGQLPIEHEELDNTAKFLSQVGDYTYSLSKKSLNGEQITNDEKKKLAELSEYASVLSDNLYKLENTLFNGNLSFESAKNVSNAMAKSKDQTNIGKSMQEVESNFQNYPSLIYDGPFSDHVNRLEAKHIKGAKEVTKDVALKKAKTFFDSKNIKKIAYSGSSEGTIEAYKYTVTDNNSNKALIEISKMGGHVLFMIKNRDVQSTKYTVNEAIKIGSKFLLNENIHSMKESYYEISENTITINYAYVKDNITMYPDLIKIKIALDNGEILGYESQGYLMAHTEKRNLNPIKLTEEQSKKKVSKSVDIISTNLAVIPLDGGKEVLCYEHLTKLNNKKFIIYINASTGNEEQILMLMENENGTLTL